jgi:hypothetical protein
MYCLAILCTPFTNRIFTILNSSFSIHRLTSVLISDISVEEDKGQEEKTGRW